MPAFEAIASTSISSTTATITFSSIPSSYEHLQIRVYARNSDSASNRFMTLTFNSDTGTNYTRHYLEGNDSNLSAVGTLGETSCTVGRMAANSAAANTFGSAIIEIVDYASANKYTTVRAFGGFDTSNTTGYLQFASGLWLNTAAVSTITLGFTSGSFLSGSTASLYGLRSA